VEAIYRLDPEDIPPKMRRYGVGTISLSRSLALSLGVINQFLFTTGKLGLKSVSRFFYFSISKGPYPTPCTVHRHTADCTLTDALSQTRLRHMKYIVEMMLCVRPALHCAVSCCDLCTHTQCAPEKVVRWRALCSLITRLELYYV
jgi:hypothetical protein